MELTPLVPVGRQIIERYAPSGFRITGVIHRGAVLVFPDRTVSWSAGGISDVTWESLSPVIEDGGVRILLLGLGRLMRPLPSALRNTLRAAGIIPEPMDTGAACRTFNVLVAEDRRVAAALLPLSETP
jgi:uncharacterized protein